MPKDRRAVSSFTDLSQSGRSGDIVVGAYQDSACGGLCGAAYVMTVQTNSQVTGLLKIANGVNGFPAGALAGGDQFGRGCA
jgi:hypothetical protein